MKLNLKHLNRFCKLFGIKYGLRLYNQFKLSKLNNIQLPHIAHPISLRSGTSDEPTFFQVFIDNEYDLKYIPNPKLVIDGGANVGLFTVLIKNKFPEIKVIAIEPDKENFQLLQQNTAGYKDVHYENCGLWNRATNLKVYDKFDMGKWAMVVEETTEDSPIKAISINDLINKYSIDRIDILKLDIETSEKVLFSNNYENWLPKTKMIIIELHDWMEEGCSKPFFTAINKTFNKYQYQIIGENTIIINHDID